MHRFEEWIEYREELRRSDLPGLAPFIRQADESILARRVKDK